MTAARAKKYIETQVNTASKEQLLLMLLDGGIRFARLGKENIRTGNLAEAYQYIVRSQKIVMELLCSLDKSVGEDIYKGLTSLYKFIYFRLAEASLRKSEDMVDEALQIYTHLRETWAMAIEQRQKDAPGKHSTDGHPPHHEGPRCAISIQG